MYTPQMENCHSRRHRWILQNDCFSSSCHQQQSLDCFSVVPVSSANLRPSITCKDGQRWRECGSSMVHVKPSFAWPRSWQPHNGYSVLHWRSMIWLIWSTFYRNFVGFFKKILHNAKKADRPLTRRARRRARKTAAFRHLAALRGLHKFSFRGKKHAKLNYDSPQTIAVDLSEDPD